MVAYMVIWEHHPNVMSLIGHTQFTPRSVEQIVYSLLAKVDHIEVEHQSLCIYCGLRGNALCVASRTEYYTT
jgi:hypothetical protein